SIRMISVVTRTRLARRSVAAVVGRHAGARRLFGIVELRIARGFVRSGFVGMRRVHSPRAPLVGGLFLGLVVFHHAVVRVRHSAAPFTRGNGCASPARSISTNSPLVPFLELSQKMGVDGESLESSPNGTDHRSPHGD